MKRARQRRVGYEQHRRALIEDEGEAPAQKIDEEVRSKLEMRIRKLGDDGLLEYLAGYFDGDEPAVDGRARTLAEGLLDRRLYKRAHRLREGLIAAGSSTTLVRLRSVAILERKAAAYVGTTEDKVAIWLPDPKMRVKTAEVLVDFGEGIAPFNKFSRRGKEIYRDHEELWTITVFVHDDLRRAGHESAILARLAELMGVEWDMQKPPGAKRPLDWPLARALASIKKNGLAEHDIEELLKDPDSHMVAHRSGDLTFKDMRRDARSLIRRFRRRKANPGT